MSDLETKLAAYADGELDEAGVAEVEALIASDPGLRRTVEIHRETAALLRAACAEPFYAQGTRPVLARMSRRRFSRSLAWAAAAAVAGGVFGAGVGANWAEWTGSEMAKLVDEVAEYHGVFSRETRHLVEVPASETPALQAWLSARVGRPLAVPDLSAQGVQFAGGRMLVVDGQPVAELMYTRPHGLPIAVCVTKLQGAATGRPGEVRLDRRGAVGLASWHDGRHAFIVVGELSADELRRLVAVVQPAYG